MPENQQWWQQFDVSPQQGDAPAEPDQDDWYSQFDIEPQAPQEPLRPRGSFGAPRISPIAERSGRSFELRERESADDKERVGQMVTAALGAPFDYTDRFAQSGSDFALEFDMARSRDFESMQEKFINRYPEGDIRTIDIEGEGSMTVARKSPDSPYRELGVLAPIAAGIISEPGVFGTLGSFAGPWGTAAGTALGEGIQRGVERLRGYEDTRSTTQNVTSMLVEGGIAGAADVATRGAMRALRISPRQADAVDAIAAQERLAEYFTEQYAKDFPELMSGQVAGPFIRGAFLQSAATSPTNAGQRALNAQGRRLYEIFTAAGNDIPADALGDTALELIAQRQRQIVTGLDSLPVIQRAETAGLLREAVEVWERTTTVLRNRAYADADRLADGVTFNIGPVKASVSEIRRGVVGRGQPVQVETEILGPTGRPMTRTEIPDVRVSERLRSDFVRILDDIDALDPTMVGHRAGSDTDSSLIQISTLRSRLFDLKENPDLDSDTYRHANRLWSELTDSMLNPEGNVTPEFVEAFANARNLHRTIEEGKSIFGVKSLLNSNNFNPESVAARYTHPGRFTEVNAIKDLLASQDGAWEGFAGLMREDLLYSSKPSTALARLDRFGMGDQRLLRLFMSEEEEAAARGLLSARIRMESAPYQQAIRKFSSTIDRAQLVLEKSTPSELAEMISLAGGADSELGQALRGVVMRDIMSSATETTPTHGDVIAPGKLVNAIKAWKESDKLQSFMTDKDFQMIQDMNLWATNAYLGAPGAGGSIMAAQLRQDMIKGLSDLGQGKTDRLRRVGQVIIGNAAALYNLTRPAMRVAYQPLPERTASRIRMFTFYSQLGLRAAYEEEESNPTVMENP